MGNSEGDTKIAKFYVSQNCLLTISEVIKSKELPIYYIKYDNWCHVVFNVTMETVVFQQQLGKVWTFDELKHKKAIFWNCKHLCDSSVVICTKHCTTINIYVGDYII